MESINLIPTPSCTIVFKLPIPFHLKINQHKLSRFDFFYHYGALQTVFSICKKKLYLTNPSIFSYLKIKSYSTVK